MIPVRGIANQHLGVRWCRPRNRETTTLGRPLRQAFPYWRETVPRAPWVRRRRATDSPRPAGRRWAGRLRQRSSVARQAILVKVTRRGRTTVSGLPSADTRHLLLPIDLD